MSEDGTGGNVTAESGPLCWRNWRAFDFGTPSHSAYEVPLFSDTSVTGEIQCGPYLFLNPVPSEMRSGVLRAAIYMRVDEHYQLDNDVLQLFKERKTDESSFIGGDRNAEIAALVSLLLGIRCRAGGITRLFSLADSPRGRPVQWMMENNPELHKATTRRRIPNAYGQKSLNSLSLLKVIPSLDRASCVEVLRAARLYQDALWLAESEPDLCWLMLVSSVETAACVWRAETYSAVERFRSWGHAVKLEPLLRDSGGEPLVERVAEILAPISGSTRSFVEFLMKFCPDPPPERPSEPFQMPWDEVERRAIFSKVYQMRSRALHSGQRFPPPMSEPPYPIGGSPVPAETPIGIASASEGGIWMRDDIPILLHAFEDIARRALMNWLASFN